MARSIVKELREGDQRLAVIGLGYVGLPIALEFANDVPVLGFDIAPDRVEMLKKGEDPSRELPSSAFENKDIIFSSDPKELSKASVFIIGVPTPIDESRQPDLGPVLKASEMIGDVLKKGDTVIYESTVYPGCTEEDCVPVLEEHSGLKFCDDFWVGYSPERINPGDKKNTIRSIKKVVSACCDEALDAIAELYELVVDAGVHKAPEIKVAEAAKVIENTQRDVNIALINELSIIFDRVGINTYDVLDAAATKWNFLPFTPGLVGGHCIGVDPYYLTHKARQLGYHAKVINSGRYVNDSMGFYIGKQTVKRIIAKDKNVLQSRVLIMGATFKKNVSDIRNSRVVDVVHELESFGVHVDVVDPHADPQEVQKEYGFQLASGPDGKYDAVIITIDHDEYKAMEEADFKKLMDEKGVLVDIKGIHKGHVKDLDYMSL